MPHPYCVGIDCRRPKMQRSFASWPVTVSFWANLSASMAVALLERAVLRVCAPQTSRLHLPQPCAKTIDQQYQSSSVQSGRRASPASSGPNRRTRDSDLASPRGRCHLSGAKPVRGRRNVAGFSAHVGGRALQCDACRSELDVTQSQSASRQGRCNGDEHALGCRRIRTTSD